MRDRAGIATLVRRILGRQPEGSASDPGPPARGAYDAAYWDRKYAPRDPWGLEHNAVEADKYAMTLELCGEGPFGRALEIGCGEGIFTKELVARCRVLVAVDISRTAVGRARRRLAGKPGVTVLAMTFPADFPAGEFDLIVASDMLYYLSPEDIGFAAARIVDALAAGGRFVALHWAGSVVAGTTGDLVHDRLVEAITTVPHVHHATRDIGEGRPYRIDVWEKRACS